MIERFINGETERETYREKYRQRIDIVGGNGEMEVNRNSDMERQAGGETDRQRHR